MDREPPHLGFRPDIQGLRALAVGLVVLNHAGVPGVSGGFVGVDVFFVISGFLITGLLLKDAAQSSRISLTGFYTRRALRILPAATLVLLCTALAATQLLDFLSARQVLNDSIWATFFAANVKFGRDGTDYFHPGHAVSPLQHFWSLAVEEQFYLVWPALLAVTLFGLHGLARERRGVRRRRVLRGRVVLVLIVIGGLSLALSLHETSTHPTSAYFSTFSRAWELAFGAMLAALLPALARLPTAARAGLGWAGLAAVLWAAVHFDAHTPFPGHAALIPVLGACALLVGGIGAPRGGTHLLLARQPLRFVGDISYSLYLWHWPVLVLAVQYAGHPLHPLQNALLVLAAVLLSIGSYYGLENPIRRTKRIWGPRQARALLMWPGTVTLVVLVAFVAQPVSPVVAHAEIPRHDAGGAVDAVRAAVAAGQRGDPIPHTLTPGLESAAKDFKSLGECSAYKRTTSKLCEFGDPVGTRQMVLFGNSHATMWNPALSQITKAAHWRMTPLVKEACHYPDYVTPSTPECSQWFTWALGQIRRLHPDLIVVSAYTARQWQAGLKSVVHVLAGLQPLGTRVLVLSDVPQLNTPPVTCLLTRRATQRTCLWPQQPIRMAFVETTRQIARAEGVEFVDASRWFCSHLLCPSIVDGIITYADFNHITGSYARYLAPDLRAELHLERSR